MEEQISYEVCYRYYQYEDGSGQNGTFTSSVELDLSEAAFELADHIDDYDNLGDEGRKELIDKLIPGKCGGYFIGKAYVLEVSRRELDRELNGFFEEDVDKVMIDMIESF